MATDPIAPAKGPSADGKPFLRMHETRDPAKLRSTHWPKADPARRAYPQLPEHIIFDSRVRSQVQQKERPNGRSRSFPLHLVTTSACDENATSRGGGRCTSQGAARDCHGHGRDHDHGRHAPAERLRPDRLASAAVQTRGTPSQGSQPQPLPMFEFSWLALLFKPKRKVGLHHYVPLTELFLNRGAFQASASLVLFEV